MYITARPIHTHNHSLHFHRHSDHQLYVPTLSVSRGGDFFSLALLGNAKITLQLATEFRYSLQFPKGSGKGPKIL